MQPTSNPRTRQQRPSGAVGWGEGSSLPPTHHALGWPRGLMCHCLQAVEDMIYGSLEAPQAQKCLKALNKFPPNFNSLPSPAPVLSQSMK